MFYWRLEFDSGIGDSGTPRLPELTRRLLRGLSEASEKLLRGFSDAKRLPKGFPEASERFPSGLPRELLRGVPRELPRGLPRGLLRSFPKHAQSIPRAFPEHSQRHARGMPEASQEAARRLSGDGAGMAPESTQERKSAQDAPDAPKRCSQTPFGTNFGMILTINLGYFALCHKPSCGVTLRL